MKKFKKPNHWTKRVERMQESLNIIRPKKVQKDAMSL